MALHSGLDAPESALELIFQNSENYGLFTWSGAKNSRNIREKYANNLRNIREKYAKNLRKICEKIAKKSQKIKIC